MSTMTEADIAVIPGPARHAAPLEIAIRRVADRMHQLNQAIVAAVEAGATIELLRCSRHHDRKGRWGDQMQPIVTITKDQED